MKAHHGTSPSHLLSPQPPPVTGSKVALRALTRVMVSQAAPVSPVAAERTQVAYQALCAGAS